MTPGRHAAVSGLLAAGCGFTYGAWEPAVAAFVAGTCLDADHLVDFKLNRLGRFTPRRFVRACNEFRFRRFYLLAHALEWILPFLVWTALAPVAPWVRAAGLGLGAHMVMDLAGNGMSVRSYFLLYRLAHGFDSRVFVLDLPPTGLAYWGSLDAFRRGRPFGAARDKSAKVA